MVTFVLRILTFGESGLYLSFMFHNYILVIQII